MRSRKRKLAGGLLLAVSFAVLAAIYAVVQLAGRTLSLSDRLPVVASFACFGVLVGAVFAFDGESELRVTNRPFVRIAVGCVAGLILSLVWGWRAEGMALTVLVCGILAYLGTLWAKYVDLY